jgi:hypothetical protein
MKLSYTRDELLAEHRYAQRIRHDGMLFHGGLDEKGRYRSPRSLHRADAIETWTARLAQSGLPTKAMRFERRRDEFFPSVAQAKLLLRSGAQGAMTRILTLIGITEGFGNDGIRALPVVDFQRHFVESIEGTALAHLHGGLLEAHGADEAGRGGEGGHDAMWYAIRDAALDHPRVTPDMYENLPIAPPPGYSGPARPAPEAMSAGDLLQRLFPQLDPLVEIELSVFAQILFIEIVAYDTFAWAREVLSDRECSAAPQFAPWMVDCIQQDEGLHVGYLQCALAEARARTLRTVDGGTIAGEPVIDAICDKIIRTQTGGRRERMLAYRMRQIRKELSEKPGGDRILAEFESLGPVPGTVPASQGTVPVFK